MRSPGTFPQRRAGMAAVAAAILLALGGCSKPPAPAPLAPGTTVLALGDSLTYGTGAGAGEGYPEVLAALTGWNVINAGIPGETAAQGCARAKSALDEHRPALMLVMLGGNDFLRRLPESGVRDALDTCVAAARSAAVPMVLIPVPRFGLGGLADAPLYREFAQARAVPVVDSGFAVLLAQPDMRADSVHLNAAGYRAMAQRMAAGLAEAGYRTR